MAERLVSLISEQIKAKLEREGRSRFDVLGDFGLGVAEEARDRVMAMPLDVYVRIIARAIISRMQPRRIRRRRPAFSTIEAVVEGIRRSRRILVLTGAGVSTSCGIPDFRSKVEQRNRTRRHSVASSTRRRDNISKNDGLPPHCRC